MVAMRMRWEHGHKIPFAGFYVVRDADRVVVLVVNTVKDPVVLQDEWGLFPSDRLVTQLCLLEAT
jgi:hypothetical protein